MEVAVATLSAEVAIGRVMESAEKIRNDATQYFPEAASVGDAIRQGDIFVTLMDAVPENAKPMQFRAQLAPGTTQGSRHCMDSAEGVEMFELNNAGPLDGPIMRTSQIRKITHPEHGHWVIPPGVYKIDYQRDLADEERRVMD